MCGPSAASMAEARYQQIKPEKLPLPSLKMGDRVERTIKYGQVRTGQARRSLLMPFMDQGNG